MPTLHCKKQIKRILQKKIFCFSVCDLVDDELTVCTHCSEGDKKNRQTNTEDECLDLCRKDQDCEHWNWFKDSKSCNFVTFQEKGKRVKDKTAITGNCKRGSTGTDGHKIYKKPIDLKVGD